MGFEQSRRDDLESLGYLFVYLYSGGLPWQGTKAKTKTEKYNRIMELKLKMVPNEICKFLPGDNFFNNFNNFQKELKLKRPFLLRFNTNILPN